MNECICGHFVEEHGPSRSCEECDCPCFEEADDAEAE